MAIIVLSTPPLRDSTLFILNAILLLISFTGSSLFPSTPSQSPLSRTLPPTSYKPKEA